jgi:hypothetical protein
MSLFHCAAVVIVLLASAVTLSWQQPIPLDVCFSDMQCLALGNVTLTAQEFAAANMLCNSYTPFARYCSTCLITAAAMFDANVTDLLFEQGLVGELYTIGFGMYSANAQLRSQPKSVPVGDKQPILLTAATLAWHRARNRVFADKYVPVAFRAEPNVQNDGCWFAANLPAFERLTSNLTSFTFMSASASMHFPLQWPSLQSMYQPFRILAIWRNVSSPTSAAYLWPVSTILQSELTYLPGEFFFHLACRRMTLQPLVGASVSVAVTLMYEASESQTRLSAKQELTIEKALNASIDAWSQSCMPWWCLENIRAVDISGMPQPVAVACVDMTTKLPNPAGRKYPARLVPNAICQKTAGDVFRFVFFNFGTSWQQCLTVAANTTVATVSLCTGGSDQVFVVHRNPANANSIQVELQASGLCLDPSGNTLQFVACSSLTSLSALSFVSNAYMRASSGVYLSISLTATPVLQWTWNVGTAYIIPVPDVGAQIEDRLSNPPALQAMLR